MVNAKAFCEKLEGEGIDFFTGVPDSLLKDLCSYIIDTHANNNIIAANEGNAIGIAAGHYLATGNPAAVYLQNSGIGNVINPLLSLAAKEVYQIPMLLIVGWRGEPGVKDEPQHVKQGEVMEPLLKAMGVRYGVLPNNWDDAEKYLTDVAAALHANSEPYVMLVRKGTFEKYTQTTPKPQHGTLTRESALEVLVNSLPNDAIIVSTTGKLSRELFEIRERNNQGHEREFLTVGSMGHCSSIALGIARSKPNRLVYCLDGDGSLLMHLGALGVVGHTALPNLKHIVFNNHTHDSVGGQPTAIASVDICELARSANYSESLKATTEDEIRNSLQKIQAQKGPAMLEITVLPGARKDLGRPTRTPIENKDDFMGFLK